MRLPVTVGPQRPEALPKPLRVDAERNRRRILSAADELFTRRGLDVGLDEIARHAGVGTATVYRRFPDKTELIRALCDDRLDRLEETARQAAAHPDPWRGLVQLVESVVRLQIEDRGLRDVIFGLAGTWETIRQRREQILPIATAVLRRAQAAGVVRPDLEMTDLATVQLLLGQLGVLTADVHPDLWRRHLGLLLDGLRTRRTEPTPLEVAPLTPADQELLCGR